MPTIALVVAPKKTSVAHAKVTLDVVLQGFTMGQRIDVSFLEMTTSARSQSSEENVLGTAAGVVAMVAVPAGTPEFTFLPDDLPPDAAPGQPPPFLVAFRFKAPRMPDDSAGAEAIYMLELTADEFDLDEGPRWELQVREDNLDLRSRSVEIAHIRRQVDARKATYDWHDGNTVLFYRDASEDAFGSSGVFKDIHDAIRDAQDFIFIADWSFHPMMRLNHGITIQDTVGWQLVHKPANTLVAIHTWNHTAPLEQGPMKDTQNDTGGNVLDRIAGGVRPANVLWRASSRDAKLGDMSHHQKYVILDCAGADGRRDIKVFFGGLDLTQGRFDWGEHPYLPNDGRCAFFRLPVPLGAELYDDWYNGEFGGDRTLPREPWHDVHGMIQGPAAWDFVREFVGRWNVDAGIVGAEGNKSDPDIAAVFKKFRGLFNKTRYVQQWEPHPGPISAQVYRSMPRIHWTEKLPVHTPARIGSRREFLWTADDEPGFDRSIQHAYRRAIDQAEKFIYIETQYLISSGSAWRERRPSVANDLAERIVRRTLDRIESDKPFHTYVLMPMFPESVPTSPNAIAQRQFEWRTMEYMATAIDAAARNAGKNWEDYLSFFFLANWTTVPVHVSIGTREQRVRSNGRYMIYVHSKLMIVDDRYVILGSANLNERSLAGDRDIEICCGMWPTPGREDDATALIRCFRERLWTEHFGVAKMPVNWEEPQSGPCVTSARQNASENYQHFRQLIRYPTDGHICLWPLSTSSSIFRVEKVAGAFETDPDNPQVDFLPDGVCNNGTPEERDIWRWDPRLTRIASWIQFLAE